MERAEELYQRLSGPSGMQAIDQMILNRESEGNFLDFIKSNDGGSGRKLHIDDRNNLSRAICGFANSDGGVIIWGVHCRSDQAEPADVVKCKVSLIDAPAFKSYLESAVSGCVLPVHMGIKNHVILKPDGNGKEGFVITFIPRSDCPPHQIIPDNKYLIRAGSSFVSAPHQVLAGMFGRRPQPLLIINPMVGPLQIIPTVNALQIKLEWVFFLQNRGAVIARETFVNINIIRAPGQFAVDPKNPVDAGWDTKSLMTMFISSVAPQSHRFTPGSKMPSFLIEWAWGPPECNLDLEIIFGCEGAPVKKFKINRSREELQIFWDTVSAEHMQGILSEDRRKQLAIDLLQVQLGS